MPHKNPEIHKAYQKKYAAEWFVKNHEEHLAKIKNRRLELKLWLDDIKSKLKCEHCGILGGNHPEIICFHHIDEKYESVSSLTHRGCSKKKILNEIDKCIPLCKNCHRLVHYNDFKLEEDIIEWYNKFRRELICEICGERNYRCIDLHHTDPSKKTCAPSSMLRCNTTIERICEEICKCRAICSNCHGIIHKEYILEER